MRQSGRIVRQVLDYVRTLVAPGVTTMDLERAAEKKIAELGALSPRLRGILRLSLRAVHVGERRDCARNSVGEANAERRAISFRSIAASCSTVITAMRQLQCR